MKLMGTVLLLAFAVTSLAFADDTTAPRSGAQGAQTTQGTQDNSGVVVKKSKKDEQGAATPGSQTGTQQGGPTGGSSN